jgi:hypothetical protein
MGWRNSKKFFELKLSKNVKIKTILYVVLCGCETWSLTLREECRPRVFWNRVLRRLVGPKRDEVTGEWRRLHNEELHAVYSLRDIIQLVKSRRQMRRACSMCG